MKRKIFIIICAIAIVLGAILALKSINKIDLKIDNSNDIVTNAKQMLHGSFSSESNVISIKYTIATEIDDYNITDSGNAVIYNNTYSVNIKLKPQINKITVTATTENGKTESRKFNITYDSGKMYELNESNISYDNDTNTQYVNNIVLIFFNEGVSDELKNEIVSSIDGKVVGSINGVNQWQVEINAKNLNELEEICKKLMSIKEVVYADIDRVTNAMPDISVNDPWKNENGGNWYLNAIEAYSAWDYNDRFSNINIGIIDLGFDTGHEDLKGKIHFPQQWLQKTNSIEYHGTHVAGIIGANANNEKGITGLVWKSKLYCVDWEPTKKQDWNTSARVLSGLTYTVEAGAKVVNYSLGLTSFMRNGLTQWDDNDKKTVSATGALSSIYMYELLNKGYDFIVVQSAGNGSSGKNDPNDEKEKPNSENILAIDAINNGYFCSVTEENIYIPENSKITKEDILNRIIIVGNAKKNIDGTYQQEVTSNGGEQVDICAPGTDIFSTVPWRNGNYTKLSGTSMAAPMVTSVCGLVWSINDKFTGKEVKEIVCNSYDRNIWVWDNPDGKHTTNDKYRMLNAKLSVEEALRRTDGQSIKSEEANSETNFDIMPYIESASQAINSGYDNEPMKKLAEDILANKIDYETPSKGDAGMYCTSFHFNQIEFGATFNAGEIYVASSNSKIYLYDLKIGDIRQSVYSYMIEKQYKLQEYNDPMDSRLCFKKENVEIVFDFDQRDGNSKLKSWRISYSNAQNIFTGLWKHGYLTEDEKSLSFGSGGALYIDNNTLDGNGFDFKIKAWAGTHTGENSGHANFVSSTKAEYKTTEYNYSETQPAYEIYFELLNANSNPTIRITTNKFTNSEVQNNMGAFVYADGDYLTGNFNTSLLGLDDW